MFEIVFNEELRFKEPIQKGDLKIEKYEEFIENAEIENLILNDPTRKQLNELKKAMRPS